MEAHEHRSLDDATPAVGVIIIHYGRTEPTLSCLTSVLEDSSPVKRAIVIVDNMGNIDAEHLGSQVDVLARPDNPGFGGGANAGVDALPGHQVYGAYVILNNDLELHAGFLSAAVAALSPGVGAVGGPVNDGHTPGELWYAGGDIDFVTGTVSQSCSREQARHRGEVGFIPGAALALSPEAWRQVGGFDPSYFLYNEDIDLCLRLRRAKWRLVFEPAITSSSSVASGTYKRRLSRIVASNSTTSCGT